MGWGRSRISVRKDREREQHQPQGLGCPQTSGVRDPSSVPSHLLGHHGAGTATALGTLGPGTDTAGERTLPRPELPGGCRGGRQGQEWRGGAAAGRRWRGRGWGWEKEGKEGNEGRTRAEAAKQSTEWGRAVAGRGGGLGGRRGLGQGGGTGQARGRTPPAGTPFPWGSEGPRSCHCRQRRDTGQRGDPAAAHVPSMAEGSVHPQHRAGSLPPKTNTKRGGCTNNALTCSPEQHQG